jgi:hypothetical protein
MTEFKNDILIHWIRDTNFVFKFEKDKIICRLNQKNRIIRRVNKKNNQKPDYKKSNNLEKDYIIYWLIKNNRLLLRDIEWKIADLP